MNLGFLTLFVYILKSEISLGLVLSGIPTHNLLIFGQTTEPSFLGERKEDTCLPKLFYLLGKGGYVFGSIGLSVCLFVDNISQKVMNGLG